MSWRVLLLETGRDGFMWDAGLGPSSVHGRWKRDETAARARARALITLCVTLADSQTQ